MGKFFSGITAEHQAFIIRQHVFFVATAPLDPRGHVNLSPKGLDAFRVLSPNQVAYMDLISSGNETSAHTMENGRITFMFCSFDKVPNILRLYGRGITVLPGDADWNIYAPHFKIYPSTRQIIVAEIHKVQTSCGFGVPIYDYQGERTLHFEWAARKTEEDLKEYMKEKNTHSLDGLPAPLLKSLP